MTNPLLYVCKPFLPLSSLTSSRSPPIPLRYPEEQSKNIMPGQWQTGLCLFTVARRESWCLTRVATVDFGFAEQPPHHFCLVSYFHTGSMSQVCTAGFMSQVRTAGLVQRNLYSLYLVASLMELQHKILFILVIAFVSVVILMLWRCHL